MSYSYQSFSYGQNLSSTAMTQMSDNIRDHTHGSSGVNASMQNITVTGSLTTDFFSANSGGIINGGLAISGTVTFSRSTVNSYTRLTPNYCRLTKNANDPQAFGTSLTRDTIATVTAPYSATTAIVLSFLLAPGANNANGARNVTVYTYSDSAGTAQIGRNYLSIYEASSMGIGAGTVFVGLNGMEVTQVLPSAGADIFLKFTDDSGNHGGVSYQIAGYYD